LQAAHWHKPAEGESWRECLGEEAERPERKTGECARGGKFEGSVGKKRCGGAPPLTVPSAAVAVRGLPTMVAQTMGPCLRLTISTASPLSCSRQTCMPDS
jgi:hypothetical protein